LNRNIFFSQIIESLLTSSESVLFFLVNWGKILPSSAEAQPSQEEFLTPIRQTLLLYEHEGRLHPVTNAHYYKMWVQFTSPHSIEEWICYFLSSPHSLQLMNWLKNPMKSLGVVFSPHSIEEWVCYFFTSPHSLQLMNWLKNPMKSLGVQKHILLQRFKYKCDKRDKSPIMISTESLLKAWVMKAAVELCVKNWSVVWLNVSRYWTLY